MVPTQGQKKRIRCSGVGSRLLLTAYFSQKQDIPFFSRVPIPRSLLRKNLPVVFLVQPPSLRCVIVLIRSDRFFGPRLIYEARSAESETADR